MLYSVKSEIIDPFDYYDETTVEGQIFIRLSPARKLEQILKEFEHALPVSFTNDQAQRDLIVSIGDTTYLKVPDNDELLEYGLFDPTRTRYPRTVVKPIFLFEYTEDVTANSEAQYWSKTFIKK